VTLALLLCRTALALVFAGAGSAKLLDRAVTRQTLSAFGAPNRLTAPAAFLLPLVELALAAALLTPGGGRWAAAFALALLAVFSAGVANSLAHGRHPPCRCFGRRSSSPAGWQTLARNAVLAAPAAFVATQRPGGAETGTPRIVMLALLVLLAAMLGLFLASRRLPWLSLTRLEARAIDSPLLGAAVRVALQTTALLGMGSGRPAGLPPGSPAPQFSVRQATGARVTLTSLLSHGKPALLVFGDGDCKPCVALMPTITRWQHELRDRLTIALITSGSAEQELVGAATGDEPRVLIQQDRAVISAYRADATPSAVLVAADGRVASHVAVGAAAIQALVESVAPAAADVTSAPSGPPDGEGADHHGGARELRAWW